MDRITDSVPSIGVRLPMGIRSSIAIALSQNGCDFYFANFDYRLTIYADFNI